MPAIHVKKTELVKLKDVIIHKEKIISVITIITVPMSVQLNHSNQKSKPPTRPKVRKRN